LQGVKIEYFMVEEYLPILEVEKFFLKLWQFFKFVSMVQDSLCWVGFGLVGQSLASLLGWVT
jgi:hypothetical protein